MTAPTSEVFGRTVSTHPYESALADWQRSGDMAKMAMACNIRHDHRISLKREEQFDHFCHQPRTAGDLEKAIHYYFEKKIRTRHYPHFVYHEINAGNLICGHAKLSQKLAENSWHSLSPLLNKELRLLRIIDLNNLRISYRSLLNARRRKRKWADSFEFYYSIPRDLIKDKNKEQQWVDEWLDEMLNPGDADRRDRFVAAVLDLLNCVRRATAFQPTWATTLEAFEPQARSPVGEPNPDRWVQIMGMGKNPHGHWFIALTYTVGEAGTVARPTQLDGGWYEYHFPSPRETPLESGGHAMDLRLSPTAAELLPEYIHKQIEHPVQHWHDAGNLLGRTSDWRPPDLISIRRAHQALLTSTYKTEVYTGCPNRDVCRICGDD